VEIRKGSLKSSWCCAEDLPPDVKSACMMRKDRRERRQVT
jgi:hypothetical protein